MLEIPDVSNFDQASPEELEEIIAELVEYRARLLEDTLTAAQKAKVSKAQAQSHLTPMLTKLDETIEKLQERYSIAKS